MDRFRTKQVVEAYPIEFDFTDLCGPATVSSAIVTAIVADTSVDVTADITTPAQQKIVDKSVYVMVKGGVNGTDYEITCRATCSDGATYKLEGLMLVQDIPVTAGLPGDGPGCVIPPTVEPVSLAEAKKHLKVDLTDEDELIAGMITAAREHIEHITRRAILTQTWDICLQDWPQGNNITLPYGCLQSVEFVAYRDAGGEKHILAEGVDYIVERNGEKVGRVVLPRGGSWPGFGLYPSNPITVRFVCGWASPAAVPASIKNAIKSHLADLHERRGDAVIGQSVVENLTVDRLLASYRLWEGI